MASLSTPGGHQCDEENKTRKKANDNESLPLCQFRKNTGLDHAPKKQVQNTQTNGANPAHFVESDQHLMPPLSASDLVFFVTRGRDVTFRVQLASIELEGGRHSEKRVVQVLHRGRHSFADGTDSNS